MAHAAAALSTARAALDYGTHGDTEARIAAAFVADVIADLAGRVAGREALWGVEAGWAAPAAPFLEDQRAPAVLAGLSAVAFALAYPSAVEWEQVLIRIRTFRPELFERPGSSG